MSATEKTHKVRLSKMQRLRRLLLAVVDPRAWGHAFKVVNYYNYTHVTPWRQVRRGTGCVISPLANIANPQNLILGDRVRISANVYLWPGPGTGRISLADDVMIGPQVMISAANYRYNDGSPVTDQAMNEADIVIGRDVWIGFGAVILPGADIGEGAIIGAAAVVRGRIPAWSIVAGNPGVIVGQRRRPGTAAAALTGPVDPAILNLIRAELPAMDLAQLDGQLDAAGIDSFDLIGLRIALEQACGVMIPDAEWAKTETLYDIARLPALAGKGAGRPHSPAVPPHPLSLPASPLVAHLAAAVPDADIPATGILSPGRSHRRQPVNMPQMALSGLSESWLFKELGDIHWAMITDFLQTPSSAITDDAGDRLYATFTRILLAVEPDLRSFAENSFLDISSGLERQGAGFFFGNHVLACGTAAGQAQTMSTFAKYGEHGKNTSLIKGSPTLPDPDAIPSLSTLPEFGAIYRTRRAAAPGPALFSCDYDILPPHDINGVGLLYFAAYPTIFDLCLEQAEGRGFLMAHSTISKDICYFANSEPGETLHFTLQARSEDSGIVTHSATLSRSSDGKRMAEVISCKRRL